jgi:hypothetical protein
MNTRGEVLLSDPRKGASNPRIHESCPIPPDFPRLTDSREPTAHICRHAASSLAGTAVRTPIHDMLIVPDTRFYDYLTAPECTRPPTI